MHAPLSQTCIVNTKQEDLTEVISLYFMLEVKLSGFKVRYKLLSFADFFPVNLEEKLYWPLPLKYSLSPVYDIHMLK